MQKDINSLVKEYFDNQPIKQSLCRYFLRGLCVFSKNVCKYSHGVQDLKFKKYQQGQHIQWEYKKTDPFQGNLIPKQKRYVNLYEYQKQKIYSEDQINDDRKIRSDVRENMMREQCQKFMKVLEQLYPEQEFTQQFLERQFTRAGFNKPTTTITFKKICEYLCSSPQSVYMIYLDNKKSKLIKKASNEQIEKYYCDLLLNGMKELSVSEIRESDIKKIMFQNKSKNIPMMNLHLKNEGVAFIQYLENLISRNQNLSNYVVQNNIIFKEQANLQHLISSAEKILQNSESIFELNKFTAELMKQYNINNNNLVNQIKPILAQRGSKLYFLPMLNIIHNQKSKKQFQHQPCKCNFKAQPDLSALIFNPKQQLEKIIIIDSQEKFQQYALSFLQSEIVAVDIQGRLRKNGNIQMIQCNNGKIVYLFDIYKIVYLDFNFELFQQIKLIIKKVMLDQKIIKIFHDSRHDALSLHEIMNTCVRNVFDTSGMQIFRVQNELYAKSGKIDQKFINKISNVKTPGLNELLKKYKAPHGINPHKQQFHKLMSSENKNIFHKRPLDKQYEQYCIKDVLDLIHLYEVMKKDIPEDIIRFIGDRYVEFGYQSTL